MTGGNLWTHSTSYREAQEKMTPASGACISNSLSPVLTTTSTTVLLPTLAFAVVAFPRQLHQQQSQPSSNDYTSTTAAGIGVHCRSRISLAAALATASV